MPQYLTLYTPLIPSSGPPSPGHMEAMGKLIAKMQAANSLVAMGATVPGSCTVRLVKGAYTVADLPRAGEQGFAILQASGKDDMIRMTKEFLAVAGDG
jgi:hypothetical protein